MTKRGSNTARAVSGVLAFGVVAAVGHLVAGVVGPGSSPVLAVANSVVDSAPAPVRDLAIDVFGTADKPALFAGLAVLLVLLAVVAGLAERPGRHVGTGILVVLGVVGVWAAVSRPDGSVVWALPTLVGVAAGMLTLRLLLGPSTGVGGSAQQSAESRPAWDRRRFLVTAGTALAVITAAGSAGVALGRRAADVVAERTGLRLPGVRARHRAAPLPAGVQPDVGGVTPFLTDNDDFYRIDTALRVPTVTARDWRLRIHGMVDREITLTWDDLVEREMRERILTLTCVSNEVGGELAGTATWIGFPMAELLAEAGPSPDSDMLLSTSADGWTCGTPLEVLLDGRDALLVVGMNGEPLPLEHGYPVRQIVPGLYGFVSATKWVVDWELTRFDRATAYWTERGWGERAPIRTASRIDRPAPLADLAAGTQLIAGTAWAQQRGVTRVEVRVDGGAWSEAELATEYSLDTWRMWSWEWEATPGTHTVEVRATDGAGRVQPEQRRDPVPDGATGWHSRTFRVR